jgi:predicted amidohydrolase
MAFTIACAQISPEKGNVGANLDKIGEVTVQSSGEGVDVVVFPETSTSGYFLEGGVLEVSMSADELLSAVLERVQGGLERPIDVLVGFYERFAGNLYNAAAYLELGPGFGRVVSVYRKFFLPTYGVFDEERFVSRGRGLGVFDTRFGRFAVLVCEDIWHSIMPTLCALNGAQVILVPSASPGRGFHGESVESLDRYRRLMTAVSEEHGVWCVNCQLCGFEGGKGFVGGSRIIDPMGRSVAASPVQEEHLLLASVDLELVTIARSSSPLLGDLEGAWGELQALVAKTPQA